MSALFMFYPEPDGSFLVTIDLGECLGELFTDPVVNSSDGISLLGGIHKTVTGGTEFITIQRDRMKGGKKLANKFRMMQNHLDRGGSVMFAADSDAMFCFPLMGNHQSGTTKLTLGIQPFQNITGNATIPKVGASMIIETRPNPPITEYIEVADTTNLSPQGGELITDDYIGFLYDKSAFCRSEFFWPVLKRLSSEKGAIVTNETGFLFSLALTLVPDWETYFAYHPKAIGSNDIGIGGGLRGTYTGTGDIPQTTGGGAIDGGVVHLGGHVLDVDPAEVSTGSVNKSPEGW